MKHVSLKIIEIFLLWMVCNVALSAGTIQTGIEMGFLSLLLLFMLFYFFGKKNNLCFDYIKGKKIISYVYQKFLQRLGGAKSCGP